MEDFRVKTCRSLADALDLTEPDPGSGGRCAASSASYDPSTSCWRTWQLSLLTTQLESYSARWPRWGMTRRGELCTPPMWAPPIAEPGGSASRGWPTPTVCGNHNRKGASPTSGDGLVTAVRQWPTPTASQHNFSESPESFFARRGILKAKKNNGNGAGTPLAVAVKAPQGVPVQYEGNLNPDWVEALMGFPPGWTDVGRPLRTSPSKDGSRPGPPQSEGEDDASKPSVTPSSRRSPR